LRTTWIRAAAAAVFLTALFFLSSPTYAQEKLEIWSPWSGSSGAALHALVELYNERFPDVAVTNAAASSGPEGDAGAALRARVFAGNPPDTFLVHGGPDLIQTWVAARKMEDLAGFYRMQGWTRIFPRALVSLVSSSSGSKVSTWSIPVSVNRSNVMWYVPSRLAAGGIQPPATWDDLIAACRKLRDGGLAAPLATGESWTVLWEDAFLAALGPAGWAGLWNGSLKFTDKRSVEAWDAFGAAADLANRDVADLTWRGAMDRLVNGDAAFALAGDRVQPYLTGDLKLDPAGDFAWAPAPGTAGAFAAAVDGYGLPRGARNRASILKWLVLIGSRDGQDVFDPLAGSISPRLDSDLSHYDAYGRSAALDWRKDRIVASLAGGTAAPAAFSGGFADVISAYLTTRDAAAAARAAQALADQARLGRP